MRLQAGRHFHSSVVALHVQVQVHTLHPSCRYSVIKQLESLNESQTLIFTSTNP